jgi:hypothetical protein
MDGRAAEYELRRAETPNVRIAWWEREKSEVLKSKPRPAGKREFLNLGQLNGGVVHGFALRALDEAGNASEWVAAYVQVDEEAGDSGGDTAPPAAPDALTATWETQGLRLTWDPGTDPDLSGYRVYRTANGGRARRLAVLDVSDLEFLDPDAPEGTLRYAVSSFDIDGNESPMAAWVEVSSQGQSAVAVAHQGDGGWRVRVTDADSPHLKAASTATPPRVQVFDIRGRLVADLRAQPAAGDAWETSWSGQSRFGASVSSGVYFVRIVHQGHVYSRKLRVRR